MAADQDDLDALVRGAMKSLDDQVPTGYFDSLSDQVLARLNNAEDVMRVDMSSEKENDVPPATSLASPPPAAPTPAPAVEASAGSSGAVPREEDSGLHDIRSLAKSTKVRLSKQMPAVNPTADDDLIASSSGGWKSAVALPEPAKMISLPDLAELPSKKEVKAKEKADKAEKKAARTSGQIATPAVEAPPAVEAEADKGATVTPIESKKKAVAAVPAKKPAPANNTNKIIAFAGIGLAAAAGIVFFVTRDGGNKSADTANKVALNIQPIEPLKTKDLPAPPPPAPAAEAPKQEADTKAEEKAPDVAAVAATGTAAPEPKKAMTKGAGAGSAKDTAWAAKNDDKPETIGAKKDPAKDKQQGAGSGSGADPSFDELLNEAGVDKTKHDDKPKLEKKALTSDDFKKGMGAVDGKAKACYAGTQGTASVRVSVSPDGKIAKVSVSGTFANTPVGECVANAVRGASFAAWDGPPQSFGWSFLLSE